LKVWAPVGVLLEPCIIEGGKKEKKGKDNWLKKKDRARK